jgi:hypothetical protein
MHRKALLVLVLAPFALACGPKKPVTDWYYSAWVSEDGVAAKASFEAARQECLAKSGVRDPASVEIGGETEREFIQCMDTAHWCPPAHGCDD